VLPHISWLRTPPPCEGGLQGCHAFRGPRPRLPAWEGSEAAMCPVAPDPASLLGGLRRCHASRDTRSKHPAWEGTRATAFPATHGERIKKYSTTMVRLEGSCVTEERSPGLRHLLDMQAGGDIMTCKACRSCHYSGPLQ
jgi:hypothetical protein